MVKGVAALHRRFQKIPKDIRREVVIAMERMADQMVREMKALAPVESGALKASIGWRWGDAPRGSLSIATFRGRQFGQLKLTLFAAGGEAFYGVFQEFGPNAQPFFFPVYRANRRLVRGRVSRAITKVVKRANKR